MIVMAIIGILATLAIPALSPPSSMPARPSSRKISTSSAPHRLLHHGQAEGAPVLDDLVTDGYLKIIPEDPMTHSSTTWVTDTSDAMYSLDESEPGVNDVHSGSEDTASDGQPYSSW